MKVTQHQAYDVVIVGGGITGAALLYVLSKYSTAVRLALVEKYTRPAQVNSHHTNNSQTLHFGDIETNYTLEKAGKVKVAAEQVVAYLETHHKVTQLFTKTHKMVLAVGPAEIAELRQRYQEFKKLFPYLRWLTRREVAEVEPKVMAGRKPGEEVAALYSPHGYTVNYQKLAENFIQEASEAGTSVDLFFGTSVGKITREDGRYAVYTAKGTLRAPVVVTAAGPHSLIFARQLGYGLGCGILPVAGSFYCARNLLRGKVYTMQLKKLPFAAVHGDPDIIDPTETRFGPTAKVLPLLERHHYRTFWDFLKTSAFTLPGILSLLKIISDKIIFKFVIKNVIIDLPLVGKWVFLKDVRKIVPTIGYKDLSFGHGIGGIRPQLVNTRTKTMEMGEAKIVGEGIIFNITPSPGASVCLDNARADARLIAQFSGINIKFAEDKFLKDFSFTLS